MRKFIDADRLRANIEALIAGTPSEWTGAPAAIEAYKDVLNSIERLQEEQPATAVGKVFTNTDPMNLYVERDQWAALLGQFDNGQRVRIILVKEDAE